MMPDVQDFYERYPYPPPIDNLDRYRKSWQDCQKRRADFHLFWPTRAFNEEHSILIAGCGTSQAGKHASRWPRANVVAIDFSATSVRETERLKRKYSLNNLEVRQLEIEHVETLGRSFDQIVCTGVLHHLPDPAAGLRALRRVLNADGAMHLMVYAPYGRAGIYMLQEFCRRIGVRATDAGIRDLTVALGMLPPGHAMEHLLKHAPDFGDQAALADALLHPQDRAYSVPQLLELLETAELSFGRWVRQAPYSLQCGVMTNMPLAASAARLSPGEQYAAVELFRGTMVRHSVVAYRNDAMIPPQPISFAGTAWRHYIPIRSSDTVIIQERLPLGAAAVLINRTHTYKDIFLPIEQLEKQMFEAVDGQNTIGEIIEKTLPSADCEDSLRTACSFFERLWWHDQVVFDASRAI